MRNIDSVVEDIRSREEERAKAAESLRKESEGLFLDRGVEEDEFLQDVEAHSLEDEVVGAVDGGLVRKELHGMDIIMVRAVGVIFGYEGGKLGNREYVPSKNPATRIEYVEGGDGDMGAERASTLYRLGEEIELASRMAGDLDILLLDGSIVPQSPDRPAKDSEMRDQYEELLESYRNLYKRCESENVLLAGVVEDTRKERIGTILQENGLSLEGLEGCRDTHLLSYLMRRGERTCTFGYPETDEHPVVSDLGEYSESIYSFYLRSVKNDRPVRIDLLSPGEPGERVPKVSSVVFSLSGINSSYGIPAPLIEADQRARIERHEVDTVSGRIQAKLAHLSGTQDLRRNRRPF